MTFKLRRATAADAPALTAVYQSSFSTDAIGSLVFPRTEATTKFWTASILQEIEHPNYHFICIVHKENGSDKETIAADCYITPASVELGFCPGRHVDSTLRMKGVGHRMWSCYIIKEVGREHMLEPNVEEAEFVTHEVTLDDVVTVTPKTGGEDRKAFTAAITGAP